MPDFPSYTEDELQQLCRDHFRFLTDGKADVGFGSDYDITARLIASLAKMGQEQGKALLKATNPTNAFGAFLRHHGFCQGVGPTLADVTTDAVQATGYAIITSTTSSQTLPSGSTLVHADGTQYVTTASVTTSSSGLTLRAGFRCEESRTAVRPGHVGGGIVVPAANEVYRRASTGQLLGVRASYSSADPVSFSRWEFYNPADSDLVLLETFTPVIGRVVPVRAVSAGESGNKDVGDALVVQSPPGTIQATAAIVRMGGGRNEMAPNDVRQRLREMFARRAPIDTPQNVRDLALSMPGFPFRDVYVWPDGSGHRIIPLAKFGAVAFAADDVAIESYVKANQPLGWSTGTMSPDEVAPVACFIDVQCAPGMQPDFDIGESTMMCTVSAVTSGNTSITYTKTSTNATVPPVGARLLISGIERAAVDPYVTMEAFIVQRKIIAVTATTSTSVTVTLDRPIPQYNVLYMFVTAGGPIGQSVIDAVLAAYDSAGMTTTSTPPIPVIYPSAQASTHDALLSNAVAKVPGVVDVSVYSSLSTPGGLESCQLGYAAIRLWS